MIYQKSMNVKKLRAIYGMIYQKILEKCHYRIINTNAKSSDCYCFFIVPTVVFGVPLYNVVGPNTTDEESILTYYTNITFINHVHAGDIIINSESEDDDIPPLH